MKHEQVFLRHIVDEINFLLKETKNVKIEEFMKDEVSKRACARSLEIIGEAAKNLSLDFKKRHKNIEWKNLAALRDKIIHYYFGVNWDIVWDVIRNKLPELKEKVEKILDEIEEVCG
ncbi:MAG: DUF86 domain-containing protein [Candidatus Omnitrophica bacterium]|nr:DUF86 domain-containing protein [Candidatus Omnitrophota bacterium]